MAQTFTSLSAPQVMLWGLLFFGGIYLGFGALNALLTRRVLPALGIGRVLDPRPLQPGQLRRELTQSGISVLIFGLGMVFPWGLLQLGWARLDPDAGWRQIAAEIVVLALWNDVHFWLNHRLLHTRWLRRFHGPHHRSFVTTPWATYSFHLAGSFGQYATGGDARRNHAGVTAHSGTLQSGSSYVCGARAIDGWLGAG